MNGGRAGQLPAQSRTVTATLNIQPRSARLRDTASFWSYTAGWTAVRRLPEPAARRLFDRIAEHTWSRRGRGVRQLEVNLSMVDPSLRGADLAEASREGLRRYLRYWCEMFRMPDWSRTDIVDRFVCEREDRITASLNQGRGAIIATAHMGNYDHVAAWAAATGRPLTTVAERVKPERLYQSFVSKRTAMGIGIHPTGTPQVADLLAAEIRNQRRIVALMCDRDMSAHGVPVTFFGEPTTLPGGPARLALRTGAPLHTAPGWHTGTRTVIRIDDVIALPDWAPVGEDAPRRERYDEAVALLTQTIADRLAAGIADHPHDWHMLAPVWPGRRVDAARPARTGQAV